MIKSLCMVVLLLLLLLVERVSLDKPVSKLSVRCACNVPP
jgi:hypothetical protein